jgi:hypothetical protein
MSDALVPDAIARIERIERDAWESVCRAAPPDVAGDLGLEVHRYGGTVLTLCTRIDQGLFNRILGFGLEDGDDAGAMIEALARFRAANIKNPFIQIPPGQPALDEAARRAGLVPRQRPWVKFHRAPNDPPSPEPRVEVRPARAGDAQLFGSVVVSGFGMPPAAVPWLGALADLPGWHCYLAWSEGVAIGGGALFIEGASAWLGAGATRPEARRRGAQSAVLMRRVADARAAGASLITTETGKPLPGEEHPSYKNILRSGFAIAYERTNWSFPA